MATFSKLKFSGSTSGRAIPVTAIVTAGTTIHDAHATDLDEVWAWAVNIDTAEVTLTLEWGGVNAGDNVILPIPPQAGAILIVPGWILTGGLSFAAFASVTADINIVGYVNRISA